MEKILSDIMSSKQKTITDENTLSDEEKLQRAFSSFGALRLAAHSRNIDEVRHIITLIAEEVYIEEKLLRYSFNQKTE